jgi:hypothetical protein
MNGGFQCLRRLPLAYQKWVHLIAGLDHTKGYEGMHSSPLMGVTERPAADNVQRPVDISHRAESRDCATAPNGVLLATTDRSALHTPPWPAPFGRAPSSGAPMSPAWWSDRRWCPWVGSVWRVARGVLW